jgi:hypothetical protein
MAESTATPAKAKKKPAVVVLQPGRGKKHPDAKKVRVLASGERGGYYNHRRIKKGEVFDIYFIGDLADVGVPEKGLSWVVLADSDAAAQVRAEVAAEAEDRKLQGRKTPLPSDVAPRVTRHITGPDPDDLEPGADGGGKATGPIGDEEAEEGSVI